MSLANLPTLAEFSAIRRATPKHQLATRLDVKTAKQRAEQVSELTFKRQVWSRDRGKCRACVSLKLATVRVKKTLTLEPRQGQVHHLAGRADKTTRWDQRNGVLLCASHHDAITRHQLFVIATAADMFTTARGQQYLNGDSVKLQFVERNPK